MKLIHIAEQIRNLIPKQTSEYRPLEYLLTLPPMSKIEGVSADIMKWRFEAEGKKGLYRVYFKTGIDPSFQLQDNDLTIKELIESIPQMNQKRKYKFKIEFESEDQDPLKEYFILKKIYERKPSKDFKRQLIELYNSKIKNIQFSDDDGNKIFKLLTNLPNSELKKVYEKCFPDSKDPNDKFHFDKRINIPGTNHSMGGFESIVEDIMDLWQNDKISGNFIVKMIHP